jgi:hypothetical protein
MKTFYVCKATFEITIDPAKPETMTAAAEWMTKMAAGEVVTPPEGLPLKIEMTTKPKIVNRREDT